eukprot:7411137-Alexandrium_andersonii.AAC.1
MLASPSLLLSIVTDSIQTGSSIGGLMHIGARGGALLRNRRRCYVSLQESESARTMPLKELHRSTGERAWTHFSVAIIAVRRRNQQRGTAFQTRLNQCPCHRHCARPSR